MFFPSSNAHFWCTFALLNILDFLVAYVMADYSNSLYLAWAHPQCSPIALYSEQARLYCK